MTPNFITEIYGAVVLASAGLRILEVLFGSRLIE